MTSAKASVHLDARRHVGDVDRRIFGGFLEHMGRAVYEGVYEPGSPRADGDGMRTDVLDALRPLGMPMVRYPGGNFVSNHDWRDAIGPKAARPTRPDFAWQSTETNQFGTDEFMAWCDRLGTRPMMAVNLGTGSPREAAALVEYCNLSRGTADAELRAANGHPDPYGVELWCLGNEMDGPWQAGHVPAQTYAERALTASQLMKGLDPSIETVACGSSGRMMATYLQWDDTVLDHCWESIDYLSAHRYSRNPEDDTPSFLAEGTVVDSIIEDYRALLRVVQTRKRSHHPVHLSFDEWNVWYREMGMSGDWEQAPHLLEEVYNLEDALVCAQYLHSFIRNADVVKVACLAQIANVIAPILTRSDDLLVQSIYWPFEMLSAATSGRSLVPAVDGPSMETNRRGRVPVLDVAATHDPDAGTGMVSLVNRSTDDDLGVDVSLGGIEPSSARARLIHHDDPKAHNSWEHREVIEPAEVEVARHADGLSVMLPAMSMVTVELGLGS
jgi:alpha-N-arabinofuranosidase